MDRSRFCDYFTVFVPRYERRRILVPTRSELIEIFNWKGGSDDGESKKDAS